jgi:putative tricarboxylic transport membrane protein
MLILGVLGAGFISRITIVPTSILAPVVIVLCVIGAFALNMAPQDIFAAVAFGFLGYVFKKYGYSTLGLILGLILGPIAESSFHQALRISGGDYSIFTSSSICIVLILCIIASVAYPIVKMVIKRHKRITV